jgi:adenine-specific DNA-methyltransferase
MEGRIAFLKAHPTLVLDTRHFPQAFTDRLLASFDDLDEMTDGLLVHSENWQALNLLQEKYRERVKCIYIDPPYNTAATPILYKNDYKESSWFSLMADRLRICSNLLEHSGIISVAIDDQEVLGLRFILSGLFEQELGIAVVRSNPAGRKTKGKLAPAHEYALFYGKTEEATPSYLDVTEERAKRFPKQDEHGSYAWANFVRSGSGDKRQDRPTLFYPIFVSADDRIRIPEMQWNDETQSYDLLEQPRPGEQIVYPVVRLGDKIIEKRWQRGHERVRTEIDNYRVRRQEDGTISIDFKTYMDEESLPTTWWDDKEYASANYGALELKSLFGEKSFDFSKSVALVRDCILTSGGRQKSGVCLDFFAGSGTTGHAVIALNREDGGRRKFILVEMAQYFDTVLLPRIKKVTFTPEWKDGKPKRLATAEEAERSPRIVKVIRLESYEDALNNLSFDNESGQKALGLFRDDYLLSYMLKWETRHSETLLNVEKLQSPFSYKLHLHRDGETRERPVDLPETFNYLLGLDVKTRRVYPGNAGVSPAHYLVYRGTLRNGRTVVVLWRETQGWTEADYRRERDFVKAQKLTEGADEIYTNGDSYIPGARSLDGLFKARMFAPVEA